MKSGPHVSNLGRIIGAAPGSAERSFLDELASAVTDRTRKDRLYVASMTWLAPGDVSKVDGDSPAGILSTFASEGEARAAASTLVAGGMDFPRHLPVYLVFRAGRLADHHPFVTPGDILSALARGSVDPGNPTVLIWRDDLKSLGEPGSRGGFDVQVMSMGDAERPLGPDSGEPMERTCVALHAWVAEGVARGDIFW